MRYLVLIALAITAGCGAPRYSVEVRKEMIQEQPAEVRERLSNREFWLGMTREQVRIAHGGYPDVVSRMVNADGEFEVWVFNKYTADLGTGARWKATHEMTFHNGKLIEWAEPLERE